MRDKNLHRVDATPAAQRAWALKCRESMKGRVWGTCFNYYNGYGALGGKKKAELGDDDAGAAGTAGAAGSGAGAQFWDSSKEYEAALRDGAAAFVDSSGSAGLSFS